MSGWLRLAAMGLAVLSITCVGSPAVEKAPDTRETAPAATTQPAAIPAFPGAEGFGAYTPGGRGGKVTVVTTLEDYDRDEEPIPGSLRGALDTKEPVIVVFAVGGNIQLKRRLWVGNPYVTIAGQTAPGDGICLQGQLSVGNGNHDVVIRYLRVRLGDLAPGAGDAMGGRTGRNIIIDHCSASWSIDECVSFYRNKNTTVQWCLVAESLYLSKHYKGEHGYGGIWGGDRASFHHNLLAHHSSRNPRFGKAAGLTDFRNNVIYNWGYKSAYGGEEGRINMIANYYKSGPGTRESARKRIMELEATGQYYIADNFVVGFPEVTADNWQGVRWRGPIPPNQRHQTPFEADPVTTQTPQEAYERVLKHVGASRPRRDSLDTRIIEEVRTGTAKYGATWEGGGKGIIDSQDDVGGWPELKGGPAPADGDQDGMPDAWETARGLNPADASDAATDRDRDGYTNIEEYINSLAEPVD
ncbi:MAG: pectate lyase [Phycisphaerae bacterium]|nr:pectate lyase [Phycisphaerae bacterium]